MEPKESLQEPGQESNQESNKEFGQINSTSALIQRSAKKNIQKALDLGKSILLLGPRQTGKTTLVQQFDCDKQFTLANPKDRFRYEKNPALLSAEIEYLAEQNPGKNPLILIDEIQKLPILLDVAQDLIDRKLAKFILTGSSARKLRRSNTEINLLPGRLIPFRMDPLTYTETPESYSLESFLFEGSLPEIVLCPELENQEMLLDAYVMIYLEEEVRAEALVRDLGSFGRFLELAASESGKIINFSKLSREIGVPQPTITGYYDILEDCLIVERVEPLIESKTRKKLSRAQKYLFYDLGVRRIAAHEGRNPPKEHKGHLLEHWVGLELIRQARQFGKRYKIKYWSDPSGPEVDWIIETPDQYIPIEVKWTENPHSEDAKHLELFLSEYPNASKGFVICNTPHPLKLTERVTALPWRYLGQVFPEN